MRGRIQSCIMCRVGLQARREHGVHRCFAWFSAACLFRKIRHSGFGNFLERFGLLKAYQISRFLCYTLRSSCHPRHSYICQFHSPKCIASEATDLCCQASNPPWRITTVWPSCATSRPSSSDEGIDCTIFPRLPSNLCLSLAYLSAADGPLCWLSMQWKTTIFLSCSVRTSSGIL